MKTPYDRLDEKTVKAFTELIIQKMESLTGSWQQPWVNVQRRGFPENLSGRRYSNSNAFFLLLLCEAEKYEMPVFLTFLQAKENGLSIRKGEQSFPVVYKDFSVKHRETGEKIKYEQWKQLSDKEKELYKVFSFVRSHHVFNVEQTNIKEIKPELWKKLQDRFKVDISYTTDRAKCAAMDLMLSNQGWICPIYQDKVDQAFYSLSNDTIHIPSKEQFVDGESFYGTLAHEMGHSTGSQGRLNRFPAGQPNQEEYGREELVAEMTAVIVMASLGIAVVPREENIAYLKGWCEEIQKEPKFLFTVLSDVNRASSMILDVTDKYQMVAQEMKETQEVPEFVQSENYVPANGKQLEFQFVENTDVVTHELLTRKLQERMEPISTPGDFCHVERIFEESKHFEFTSPSTVKTPEDVAQYLSRMISLMGGRSAILYGDFTLNASLKKLADGIKRYSFGDFRLSDAITIKGNHSAYISVLDGYCLNEAERAYVKKKEAASEMEEFVKNRNANIGLTGNITTKSTNYLNKMEPKFQEVDVSKVNWEQLTVKFGITKEILEEKGVLEEMLNRKKSSALLKVKYEGANGAKEFDARVSFREKGGEITLQFYPVRQAPPFGQPYHGYTFSDEDKRVLEQTGHLGKVVEIQPYNQEKKQVLISLDPLTNDIVHLDRDKIKLPHEVGHVALTDGQKEELLRGEPVYIKDMMNREGKKFNAFVQIDADKRALSFIPSSKVLIENISEVAGVPLSDEQKKMLKDGQVLSLRDLQSKDGRTFSANVSYNPEEGKLKFDFPESKKIKFTAEQKKALDAGEKVLLTGFLSKSGKPYDMIVYKDKETGALKKEWPVKDEAFKVKLSDEQKKALQNGQSVFLDNLQRKNGTTFKAKIIWDAKEGKFGFEGRQEKEEQKEVTQQAEKQQEGRKTGVKL